MSDGEEPAGRRCRTPVNDHTISDQHFIGSSAQAADAWKGGSRRTVIRKVGLSYSRRESIASERLLSRTHSVSDLHSVRDRRKSPAGCATGGPTAAEPKDTSFARHAASERLYAGPSRVGARWQQSRRLRGASLAHGDSNHPQSARHSHRQWEGCVGRS